MIAVIIVLILMFPVIKKTINEFMIPDKVLLVRHQIDEHAFEFKKEIKDKEKIVEFENLLTK